MTRVRGGRHEKPSRPKEKKKSFFDTVFVRKHRQSGFCVILGLEKQGEKPGLKQSWNSSSLEEVSSCPDCIFLGNLQPFLDNCAASPFMRENLFPPVGYKYMLCMDFHMITHMEMTARTFARWLSPEVRVERVATSDYIGRVVLRGGGVGVCEAVRTLRPFVTRCARLREYVCVCVRHGCCSCVADNPPPAPPLRRCYPPHPRRASPGIR